MPMQKKRKLNSSEVSGTPSDAVLSLLPWSGEELVKLQQCLGALLTEAAGECTGGTDFGCTACARGATIAAEALARYCRNGSKARAHFSFAGGCSVLQAALKKSHDANVAAALMVISALAETEDGVKLLDSGTSSSRNGCPSSLPWWRHGAVVSVSGATAVPDKTDPPLPLVDCLVWLATDKIDEAVQEAALLGLAQALERNPCLLPRLMGIEASKQTDSDAPNSTMMSTSLASLAVQAGASNRSSQLRISGGRLLSALVRTASLPGSLSCGTDLFLKELLDAVSCMVYSAVAAAAAALDSAAVAGLIEAVCTLHTAPSGRLILRKTGAATLLLLLLPRALGVTGTDSWSPPEDSPIASAFIKLPVESASSALTILEGDLVEALQSLTGHPEGLRTLGAGLLPTSGGAGRSSAGWDADGALMALKFLEAAVVRVLERKGREEEAAGIVACIGIQSLCSLPADIAAAWLEQLNALFETAASADDHDGFSGGAVEQRKDHGNGGDGDGEDVSRSRDEACGYGSGKRRQRQLRRAVLKVWASAWRRAGDSFALRPFAVVDGGPGGGVSGQQLESSGCEVQGTMEIAGKTQQQLDETAAAVCSKWNDSLHHAAKVITQGNDEEARLAVVAVRSVHPRSMPLRMCQLEASPHRFETPGDVADNAWARVVAALAARSNASSQDLSHAVTTGQNAAAAEHTGALALAALDTVLDSAPAQGILVRVLEISRGRTRDTAAEAQQWDGRCEDGTGSSGGSFWSPAVLARNLEELLSPALPPLAGRTVCRSAAFELPLRVRILWKLLLLLKDPEEGDPLLSKPVSCRGLAQHGEEALGCRCCCSSHCPRAEATHMGGGSSFKEKSGSHPLPAFSVFSACIPYQKYFFLSGLVSVAAKAMGCSPAEDCTPTHGDDGSKGLTSGNGTGSAATAGCCGEGRNVLGSNDGGGINGSGSEHHAAWDETETDLVGEQAAAEALKAIGDASGPAVPAGRLCRMLESVLAASMGPLRSLEVRLAGLSCLKRLSQPHGIIPLSREAAAGEILGCSPELRDAAVPSPKACSWRTAVLSWFWPPMLHGSRLDTTDEPDEGRLATPLPLTDALSSCLLDGDEELLEAAAEAVLAVLTLLWGDRPKRGRCDRDKDEEKIPAAQGVQGEAVEAVTCGLIAREGPAADSPWVQWLESLDAEAWLPVIVSSCSPRRSAAGTAWCREAACARHIILQQQRQLELISEQTLAPVTEEEKGGRRHQTEIRKRTPPTIISLLLDAADMEDCGGGGGGIAHSDEDQERLCLLDVPELSGMMNSRGVSGGALRPDMMELELDCY